MNSLKRNRIILVVCLVASLLLFPVILSWNVSAQSAPNPTPTLDPALQGPLSTQQAQINDLTRQIDSVTSTAQKQQIEIVEQNLNEKLWVITSLAAAISAIAAFFGWQSYSALHKAINEKVPQEVNQKIAHYWKTAGAGEMEKRVYGFDPTRLTIRLRSGRDLKRVENMLLLTDIKKIVWYQTLDQSCLEGVVVVPVSKDEDEKEFVDFLHQYEEQLYKDKVAFILYAAGYRVSQSTIDCYDNTTIANLPITVTNAVLVVGRGLLPKAA